MTRIVRVACLVLLANASLWGQPASRSATTVEALTLYPLFFHGRQVIVRGTVEHPSADVVSLRTGEGARPVFVLSRGASPDQGPAEIRGDFWDLGRLTPDDPHLAGIELAPLLDRASNGRWPAQNQVPILIVQSAEDPARMPPGLRAIALEPERFEGQTVTVLGRFRGANLYGDLPQAPSIGRWDFVIQSADAAVWVTGARPRGKGFNFDASSRLDTNRSLEVSGIVRTGRGLVWIEAKSLQLSTTPAPAAIVDVPIRTQGPPPQVAFTLPVNDETDVSTGIKVRIQFTRDMAPDTFPERVRVSYVDPKVQAQPQPPPSASQYRRDNRVLEITFKEPIERFRTVKIELLEGITAADGAPLAPFTLTFSVGAA